MKMEPISDEVKRAYQYAQTRHATLNERYLAAALRHERALRMKAEFGLLHYECRYRDGGLRDKLDRLCDDEQHRWKVEKWEAAVDEGLKSK